MALLKKIPNSLTVLRILIAAAFPFIPDSWRLGALLIALLTEFLDGYLARLLNCESDFGRMLDPVADKILIVVVAVILVTDDYITWWQLGLIAARDFMVLFGGVIAFFVKLGKDFLGVRPKFSGKVATAFQFGFLITVYALAEVPPLLMYATIASSLVAAIDYFVRGIKALA